MIDIGKNNLDRSTSPYLQQHKGNPVFWQEWNDEILGEAKKIKKPLFVSIGYSTCHWCHVMAAEAFSDNEIADFLNDNFIPIKVDREQRPDIDKFAMNFLVATQGQGGWPLNIFLSPDLKPFFAGTYFPVEGKHGLPPFIDILEKTLKWYEEHKAKLEPFELPIKASSEGEKQGPKYNEKGLVDVIKQNIDYQHFGFGYKNKFPPYNTLLFLMHYYAISKDADIVRLITKTLDAMAMRGLHDHLQGGFFRYTVDREWTIPHFEKMLYDQAMLLWTYSIAYKLFEREEDKIVAEKILKNLEETFEDDGLYFAGHDADTEHEEGATYLWTVEEIKEILSEKEFEGFSKLYDIEDGEFEGKMHLVKTKNKQLDDIESKLLVVRKKRKQPFVDKKKITGWNSLLGCALIACSRYCGNENALEKAKIIAEKLFETNVKDETVFRSSIDGVVQKQSFLEDYAALALLLTYLYEEEDIYKEELREIGEKLQKFNTDGRWHMSLNSELGRIVAEEDDHPQPSAVSLAVLAEFRSEILLRDDKGGEGSNKTEESSDVTDFKPPFAGDFYNIVVLLARGNLNEIHSPGKLSWQTLPLTSIQIRSDRYQLCRHFHCQDFKTEEALLKEIQL
ncbi:MAG: thioredoxin domain-containing protein [Candidatus Dojkabacteria bacterium]